MTDSYTPSQEAGWSPLEQPEPDRCEKCGGPHVVAQVSDTRGVTSLCEDCFRRYCPADSRDDVVSREELIRLLNTLQRHSLQTKGWQMEIQADEWGDYVEVDDIAKAFGLVVDKMRNPSWPSDPRADHRTTTRGENGDERVLRSDAELHRWESEAGPWGQ